MKRTARSIENERIKLLLRQRRIEHQWMSSYTDVHEFLNCVLSIDWTSSNFKSLFSKSEIVNEILTPLLCKQFGLQAAQLEDYLNVVWSIIDSKNEKSE